MGANVQLAKLYRRHEKEKKKEQEKVVTFVLQLEEKDKLLGEVLKELEKEVEEAGENPRRSARMNGATDEKEKFFALSGTRT
nr:hypothetical protein BaRGS_005931 [Batillaria attramentaria]